MPTFAHAAEGSPAASAAERCSSTLLTLFNAACYACATHPVTALLCTGRSQGPQRKAGATSPQEPLPKAAPAKQRPHSTIPKHTAPAVLRAHKPMGATPHPAPKAAHILAAHL